MLEIKNIPTIDGDEIEKEFGIRIFDCEFTEMVESGSYVTLYLNDNAVEDLKESIEWEQGKSSIRLNKLMNQLNLVEKLRELGYTDKILVFIFWWGFPKFSILSKIYQHAKKGINYDKRNPYR